MGLFCWHDKCLIVIMLLTNRLFNDVFTNIDRAFSNRDYSYWRMGNNSRLKELDDSYEYSIPLAGFKKEGIKAIIEDGCIYITASKGEDSLAHSLSVPQDVDLEKGLSATYEDGLLVLKLNKEKATPKIEIKIK